MAHARRTRRTWRTVRGHAPPFNLTISRIFLRVGLCSHTFSVAGDVATSHTSDHKRASLIAWTRVHAITNLNTCAKSGISGNDQWAYLMTRGGARSVRSSSRFHQASSDMASSDGHDLSRFPDQGAPRGHTGSSDLHRMGDASEIRGGVGSVRSSSRFRS